MNKHITKIVLVVSISFLAIIWKGIFAWNEGTNIGLGIRNTIARITYSPWYSTWFYTSGNVLANITGIGLTGTLDYIVTNNGTYSFPYIRGTWPYTSGMAYGPTNLWNHVSIVDTITRIDNIFPTFSVAFSNDGHSMIIDMYDNLPGIQITLDGSPYTWTLPITLSISWTYVFIVTDIAGNQIGFSVTIFTPVAPPGWGGGWGWGGWGWWGWPIGGVITAPTWQIHPSPETSGAIPPYWLELTNAYLRAHAYGITTMPTIKQANMTGYIIRKHLAKMISEFTLQFVGIKPDLHKKCNFPDMKTESLEMKKYAVLSCQLGLMWLEENGVTPRKLFDPNMYVTRAQFGTVLSRLLFGDTYNIKEEERTVYVVIKNGIKRMVAKAFGLNSTRLELMRYTKHLQALKDHGIMKQIDRPMMLELRWYVMLMLMRSTHKPY